MWGKERGSLKTMLVAVLCLLLTPIIVVGATANAVNPLAPDRCAIASYDSTSQIVCASLLTDESAIDIDGFSTHEAMPVKPVQQFAITKMRWGHIKQFYR